MSVVRDILRSYRAPTKVARERLVRATEPSGLAMLMGASVMIFVAQWPRLAQEAHLDPSIPMDARVGGAILGILFFFPLAAYALSGLIWLGLRPIVGPLSGLSVRIALFWSFFAATPLWLAHGFFQGLLGDTRVVDGLDIVVLLLFFFILFGAFRAVISDRGNV